MAPRRDRAAPADTSWSTETSKHVRMQHPSTRDAGKLEQIAQAEALEVEPGAGRQDGIFRSPHEVPEGLGDDPASHPTQMLAVRASSVVRRARFGQDVEPKRRSGRKRLGGLL